MEVAANILNKQWETADKGRSFCLGFGEGLELLKVTNQLVTKCYTRPENWRAFVNTVTNTLNDC